MMLLTRRIPEFSWKIPKRSPKITRFEPAARKAEKHPPCIPTLLWAKGGPNFGSSPHLGNMEGNRLQPFSGLRPSLDLFSGNSDDSITCRNASLTACSVAAAACIFLRPPVNMFFCLNSIIAFNQHVAPDKSTNCLEMPKPSSCIVAVYAFACSSKITPSFSDVPSETASRKPPWIRRFWMASSVKGDLPENNRAQSDAFIWLIVSVFL